jgi:urease accessory protein
MDFQLLQLADSAFPAGGFAHSAGLEASAQLGHVRHGADLTRFCHETVWSTATGILPFMAKAHTEPEALPRWDQALDAFLLNPVQNRASRTQGRAFAATAQAIFPQLEAALGPASSTCSHHAPLFGLATRTLGLSLENARGTLLLAQLRSVLSAAVRLGLVGPHEAGRTQAELGPLLSRALAETRHLSISDASQASPLLELYAGKHDELYSRLFLS